MSRIFVPSKKSGFGAQLPMDMDNPRYMFAKNKAGLEQLSPYVNSQEWRELAVGANMAFKNHAATSNNLVMCLLFGSLGVLFCPLMCYGYCVDVEAKANADIEKLPVAERLKKRGIDLHFKPKRGKFDMGGMHLTISPETPKVQSTNKTQ